MNPAGQSWLTRIRNRIAYSIKLRMVLLFLLLAAAMAATFMVGAQRAFSLGWREAAKPIVSDYVDRLTMHITQSGTPSIEQAKTLIGRLPITIRISGPQTNWVSHPERDHSDWLADEDRPRHEWARHGEAGREDWHALVRRNTADGHVVEFGINTAVLERRPRFLGATLIGLVALSLLAWLYVRQVLKPLDAIGNGAQRFGAGDFSHPIAVGEKAGGDELTSLARTINTMGQDIHQMLEAKRALLLAISHELRSPLTRARLNTELLPESAEVAPQRDALLRDLKEIADLITDLLESERLATVHGTLQRGRIELAPLVEGVMAEIAHDQATAAAHGHGLPVELHMTLDHTRLELDEARLRLLLRNLLKNALRYSAGAPRNPELFLRTDQRGLSLEVRDYGPGVPADQLPYLGEAFYRTDAARTRTQGGVGLGLYLCKLVVKAHGGQLSIDNANPGLSVSVFLPTG
jgi:signal transduction histidine kinase